MIYFQILGIVTVAVFIILSLVVALKSISEGILRLKRKKQIKHRFDKPPTAKCYCIDCQHFGNRGECYAHTGWMVADSWFCWSATPKGREDNGE